MTHNIDYYKTIFSEALLFNKQLTNDDAKAFENLGAEELYYVFKETLPAIEHYDQSVKSGPEGIPLNRFFIALADAIASIKLSRDEYEFLIENIPVSLTYALYANDHMPLDLLLDDSKIKRTGEDRISVDLVISLQRAESLERRGH